MVSEKHLPLPQKYRPMTFDDVVGQKHVVRTLRNAIESGRIANAYLFVGPRGIGKTTLSRIFAKALNCRQPNGVEPCGQCDNCREIAGGRSIDVVEMDAASHTGVDYVRENIIANAEIAPSNSRYRIFIIDECHMLSDGAWNALLKTLEEPPPHVRFIFATTEGDEVLATIVSRCQRFDLRRIQTHDIVDRLKHVCKAEKITAVEDALLAIARGADGGMRDALSSLDQLVAFKGGEITEEDALGVFGLISRSALENLADAILKGDDAAILNAIELFDSAGKNMRRLSAELLLHFRNLIVLKALGQDTSSLAATPEQIAVLTRQAQGLDSGRVFRICDQLAEMEDKLRHALSVRTLLEMTLLRCSRIATTATIEELMKAVRSMQSGNVQLSPATLAAIIPALSPTPATPPPPAKAVAAPPVKPPSPAPVAPPPPAAKTVAAPPPKAPPKPTPVTPADDSQQKLLDDPKLNALLANFPGSMTIEIKKKGV